MAIKYGEDKYYDNAYYARVGGIACSELNLLEVQMLGLLAFDLYVLPQHYADYLAELRRSVLIPVSIPASKVAPPPVPDSPQYEENGQGPKSTSTLRSNVEISS